MTFTAYPDTDDAPIAKRLSKHCSKARYMDEIRTRIQVGPDHTITGIAPPDVPPGEHVATITISTPQILQKPSRVADLPVHDIPWDGSISLRREDLYGDDGR